MNNMTTKGIKLTGPEVTEPQVPAELGGIVPATPSSSSYVGLVIGCDAGPAAEHTTADYGMAVDEGPVDPGGPSHAKAGVGQTPALDSPRDSSASGRSRRDRPGPRSSKRNKSEEKRETARDERTRKRGKEVDRRRSERSRSCSTALPRMPEAATTDDGDAEVDIPCDADTESIADSSQYSADESVQRRSQEVPVGCYVRLETLNAEPVSGKAGQTGQAKARSAPAKKKKSAGKSRAVSCTPGKYTGTHQMKEHSRQKNAIIRQIEREKLESEARRDHALMSKSQSKGSDSDRSDRSDRSDTARERRALAREARTDPTKQSAGELSRAIDDAMGSVIEIARKSGNLKSILVKELKEAAQGARTLADELHRRAVQTGNISGVMTENVKLHLNIEYLQKEIQMLKVTVDIQETAECGYLHPPPPAAGPPPVVAAV